MTVKELKEQLDRMVESSNGVFNENTPILVGIENNLRAFNLVIKPEQEYLKEDGVDETVGELNVINVVGLGCYGIGIMLNVYPYKK